MPKDEETDTKEKIEEEIKKTPEDEEPKEESELEEELEEPEQIADLRDLEFSSFIQPSIEGSAPVLERVAGSQGTGFSLSGWEALSSPVSSEGTINEDDPFKYSIGGEGGGGEGRVKYVSSSENIASTPTQIDFRDVGRKPGVMQEAAFTQSSEVRDVSQPALEKYEPAKRMDVESAGRRDPFEPEKIRYDPKLPSS